MTDGKDPSQAGPRGRGAARLVVLVVGALLAGLLILVGGAPASAAPPDSNPMATWNMQRSSGRWQYALDLSDRASVVALQEVSIVPPAGAQRLPDQGNVRVYRIPATRTRGERFVLILPQGRNPARGLNLAMITSFRPDRVTQIRGVYRDALAVTRRADDALFASIHASSSGGVDAASLVRRVSNEARAQRLGNWVTLGDFNRDPRTLANDLGRNYHIYNSGGPTQLSGGQLDYAVSNIDTQNWQAGRGNNRGSDHWPVSFTAMRAGGANPTRFTITDEGNTGVLDVAGAGRANGTHVILYHPDGGLNQQWQRRPAGFQNRFDRLVSVSGLRCMDVDGGSASRAGSQMNIWACHPRSSGADTQDFAIEAPVPWFPNLHTLADEATEFYLNVAGNGSADGTPIIQWAQEYNPLPYPGPNESFYFHPVI